MGIARVNDSIREVDEELGEAALGGRIVSQHGRKGGIAERLRKALAKGFPCSSVITQSQEAAHNVLQEAGRLLLHKLGNHVGEHSANGIESLVGRADVVESAVVEQNLLNNEDGNGLTQFGSSLHDSEAQGDDFGGQQEVDDLGRVILDKSTNDTERGETKVFKGSRLGRGVQEGVEVKRDMGCGKAVVSVLSAA